MQVRILAENKRYIGGFSPRCAAGPFVHKVDGREDWQEWRDLEKYGRLFEALVAGVVQPASRIQEDFVAYFRDGCAREPGGYCEALWGRYLDRLALESDPDFKTVSGAVHLALPPMRGWNNDRSKPEGGPDKFFASRKRR